MPTTATSTDRREKAGLRPIIFLDMDDTVCLNAPFGFFDVLSPDPPPDVWERLFDPGAVEILRTVVDEYDPSVVFTTSWLRFFDSRELENLLSRTAMAFVTGRLHAFPEAPHLRRRTRADAIATWLSDHHKGEPFVILDDHWSGTGLAGSDWGCSGRVVLCEIGVGLTEAHLPDIRRALSTPTQSANSHDGPCRL